MPHDPLSEGALYTDFYQLTMAQLYYRMDLHDRPAQFDHFYRTNPSYGRHQAGFTINAGLGTLLEHLRAMRFGAAELDHLRAQTGRGGEPLFGEDFLAWLANEADFSRLQIDAIPEGRVTHPNVPLTVVRGPLALAQILETPLLNFLNYQILVATKAARVKSAAGGQLTLEFGLRRAQGRGGNAGARAALIGGADFTSNTGLSYALGLPPKGTHAHSMVQTFIALGEGEIGAFRAYAELYPDDCLLLVDTVDTLESGIPNAIRVFEELRAKGHQPMGIRLDSGDLAYLSIRAAKMLDDAGFPETTITLSNQIDELVLLQIFTQIREEAPGYGVDPDALIKRLAFGVGTRLITSAGAASLDGVYKLVAVQNGSADWVPAIKLSESAEKIPNPGQKRVYRLYDARGKATADLICTAEEAPPQDAPLRLRHPIDRDVYRTVHPDDLSGIEPLLQPVWQGGQRVDGSPDITAMRTQRDADLERLDSGVRRIINPHIYHVSLSEQMWSVKQDLIRSAQDNGSQGLG